MLVSPFMLSLNKVAYMVHLASIFFRSDEVQSGISPLGRSIMDQF